MKLALVLNHFLPGTVGGTEIYVRNLAKGLIEKGVEVIVVVPNYDKPEINEYDHQGIRVVCFPEMTEVDRNLLFGKRQPDSIKSFIGILVSYDIDIAHFHELSGSRGSTFFHLMSAKENGFKTVMTFHIAGYTCKTGTMKYMGKIPCDGIFQLNKCSTCHLHTMGIGKKAELTRIISSMLFSLGLDLRFLNRHWATGLSTFFLLDEFSALVKKIFAYTDRTISVAQWYKEVLTLNNGSRGNNVFIESGVEQIHFESHHDENFGNNQIVRIIYLGRITPSKGIDVLLEAMTMIADLPIALDVFGVVSSEDHSFYENLKKTYGDYPRINWKGRLDNHLVHDKLKAYDLLCLPSKLTEMASLVLKEAMASKMPVVVSDTIGNVEMVEHNVNGLVFASGDAISLAEQLKRCVVEKDLLSRLRSNQIPVRDLEGMVDEHFRLYTELIQE